MITARASRPIAPAPTQRKPRSWTESKVQPLTPARRGKSATPAEKVATAIKIDASAPYTQARLGGRCGQPPVMARDPWADRWLPFDLDQFSSYAPPSGLAIPTVYPSK